MIIQGKSKVEDWLKATRTESRWGCFLPDLTRLARRTSATSLPLAHIVFSDQKCKFVAADSRSENTMELHLDPRLENDSIPVCQLDLCELRILNDRRWPWVLLVPQRSDAVEIHDLNQEDQHLLAMETALAAHALKQVTQCKKINTGALGNMVSQLHVHVIARNEGDPNWPGPVWGFEQKTVYRNEEIELFRQDLLDAMKERQSFHEN